MFYPERFVDFPGDGKVKWAGLDNKSDLLDDEGQTVLVRYEEGMDMDKRKRKALEGEEGNGVKKKVKEAKA